MPRALRVFTILDGMALQNGRRASSLCGLPAGAQYSAMKRILELAGLLGCLAFVLLGRLNPRRNRREVLRMHSQRIDVRTATHRGCG
jgi:hypothetical protein